MSSIYEWFSGPGLRSQNPVIHLSGVLHDYRVPGEEAGGQVCWCYCQRQKPSRSRVPRGGLAAEVVIIPVLTVVAVTRDRGAGYETKELRERFGLKKTKQKSKPVFATHAVDAWVITADTPGAECPAEQGLYYWTPIRFFRRQLHRLQPAKDGGIQKPYGGTRSPGPTRGTLIRHVKHGLTYLGGTLKGRVSLHNCITGKRVTQTTRVEDCTILTRIAWRTEWYAGMGRRHSSPSLRRGSPA